MRTFSQTLVGDAHLSSAFSSEPVRAAASGLSPLPHRSLLACPRRGGTGSWQARPCSARERPGPGGRQRGGGDLPPSFQRVLGPAGLRGEDAGGHLCLGQQRVPAACVSLGQPCGIASGAALLLRYARLLRRAAGARTHLSTAFPQPQRPEGKTLSETRAIRALPGCHQRLAEARPAAILAPGSAVKEPEPS